jgi:predicted P-loop ATPase
MSLPLTPADLAMFQKFRVGPELLGAAKIERVNDTEAREVLALNGTFGNMAGVLFPYFSPHTGFRVAARVRRDCPEIENGREKNKYMSGFGDRRHLYLVPKSESLLADLTIPAVLVEAEKSALALAAWSERTGKRLLPIALGGCYGFRGRIGKKENARGERVDEVGPLPDLEWCRKRRTYILLDANCATNPKVRAARRELARELVKLGADVRMLNLPSSDHVNGPDDFLAAKGDDALLALFDSGELTTKDGNTRSLLTNAMALLRESPEWADVLAYNEFSLYVTTKNPAPWQKAGGANWTDYDDSRTTEWLQRHDVLISTPVTAEAVQTVAKENRFHPVRDYLNSLQWDQTPRLDNWLSGYLGVEHSPFVAAVGTRWMISAVARIFRPGCQADYTLLLEGPQGIQKSTALQILAGDDWFTDHISDLGSKDSRIELHGKWIIEFSELATVRRGELEKVKAFLTARIDHFRMPYGRRSEAVPRSCIFAASVNDQTPFTDPTGNRRWWPVRCGAIAIGALRRDRDQLWAEAYDRFKSGKVWWLETAELNQLATSEQDERYDPGVWDDVILGWIENPTQRLDFEDSNAVGIPVEPYDSDETRVTVADVLLHCIGKSLDHMTQADRNQVARCLIHAGWKRKRVRIGSTLRWFYIRSQCSTEKTGFGTSLEEIP